MSKKLTLKTFFEFIDMLEEGGEWLWYDVLMMAYFSGEKEQSFHEKLQEYLEAKVIVEVIPGIYANPRSKHRNVLYQAYDVARMIRWQEFFYESFESRGAEIGLISQVPNRLTFATTSFSYVYETPFGTAEFVHKDMNEEQIRELIDKELVIWNKDKRVFEASSELTEDDLREYKRSIDLLEETIEFR